MEEAYVPRPEFDMFCRQQNGGLKRIEAQNIEILDQLKEIRRDISERVTWDSYNKQKLECREEFRKLRGRPSWLVTTVLTVMSSITVALITGVLIAVLK